MGGGQWQPLGNTDGSERRGCRGSNDHAGECCSSNFDMTLIKLLRVTESQSLEFRLEGFNVFNHAQFYGAAAVDGEVNNDPHFGQVVSAAAPRLVQFAVKFAF